MAKKKYFYAKYSTGGRYRVKHKPRVHKKGKKIIGYF